jgi:hypothetical protein
MNQDTTHYYLVSFHERAVGIDKKMIYRDFREIQVLIERIRAPITIEQIDCADFNQPSSSFDEWQKANAEALQAHKENSPKPEDPEEKIDALAALKTSPEDK